MDNAECRKTKKQKTKNHRPSVGIDDNGLVYKVNDNAGDDMEADDGGDGGDGGDDGGDFGDGGGDDDEMLTMTEKELAATLEKAHAEATDHTVKKFKKKGYKKLTKKEKKMMGRMKARTEKQKSRELWDGNDDSFEALERAYYYDSRF